MLENNQLYFVCYLFVGLMVQCMGKVQLKIRLHKRGFGSEGLRHESR